jgi:hypothetical protein
MAMTVNSDAHKDLFAKLKNNLCNIDPVYWAENNLTLDGKPFTVHGNGYAPFADIYRYIGIKALEPTAKPLIVVSGRQVGKTTTLSVLEMYFMCSGLFGNSEKSPIRVIHAFPLLELAAAYSKTKLQQMIVSAKPALSSDGKKSGKPKSCIQSLLDQSSPTNDSLHFKQFVGGNHLWIEGVGLDADRIMGRQLSLETELPTPNGFIKLKNLKENDKLFDEKGNVCNVIKLHPINKSPEAYRILFDDGTAVEACAEHLWMTYTRRDRIISRNFANGKSTRVPHPTIKNTKEILQTLKANDSKENNHSIPNCLPLNYPEQDLPLDPYLFGLWLGDGSQSGTIETADPEILSSYNYHILPSSTKRKGNSFSAKPSKSHAYRVEGLTTKLIQLNQMYNSHHNISAKNKKYYNKHIPDIYMHSSFEQRLALIQGLMDTDGHCDKNGNIEFVQVREKLADQVYELLLSLGIKAFRYKRESWRYGKRYKDKYRIRFITRLPVFRMKRKLERIKLTTNALFLSTHRFIVDIQPIASIPMRCITVDSPSKLFLITKQCIPTHNTSDILFFDEVQRTPAQAIGSALKILTTAKYGRPSKGVQVYIGTPRRKGSDYHKMWLSSSQQYYHLGCEHCHKHFPLYTPESDDWKEIWIHGFIVKCTHCGYEQDKRQAAERGKWVAVKNSDDDDCAMIGFHINQLYMPMFTREDINNEMPGIHPINTERVFMNEVLGEFFQGDSSPITPEEIRDNCADFGRKFRARIDLTREEEKNQIVVLGIDYGARADLEQLANPDKVINRGQSYSTAVVLSIKGAGRLSIEFCTKFKRNDMESKKGLIDTIMRQYSVQLAVGDIGFSNDFSSMLHNSYGDRYLVSRAHNKVNGHIKFSTDAFPKEIVFERDHYIGELYDQMKKGMIRFPFGDYEKIAWLIEHCASMEIKPSISRGGDPSIHYVKGGTPNDGMMALLNAYIAYQFLITSGFTNHNPLLQNKSYEDLKKPLISIGTVARRI